METVSYALPTGGTALCARQGSVVVPFGKVAVYAMGKVAAPDEAELQRL